MPLTVVLEGIGPAFDLIGSGTFAAPEGAQDPGPAGPGGAYRFEVRAGPGQRLSFATMFAQSNDLFLAPDPAGVDLWPDGAPLDGAFTDQIVYWDAGTEADQEPGVGPDQAPRQAGIDQGPADPDANVRLADDPFDVLPPIAELVSVRAAWLGDDRFEIEIANVSEPGALIASAGPTDAPITPGAWAVHAGPDALFAVGAPAPEGLEALAEEGDPTALAAALAPRTGLVTPFAPGAYALSAPLFAEGEPASAGLEALAEDGDPSGLIGAGIRAFDTPAGADGPARSSQGIAT